MQDILVTNPCKVILEDFDFKKDLAIRLQCEKLSSKEICVLEEILYSPLKVSIEELCNNADVAFTEIHPILESLAGLHLFEAKEEQLLVDKERRKYFEVLIEKFTPDFLPNLDYYKELLKLAPIHLLVSWFHIPRTSNNIFNSMLEKHFQTPKMYQRYLKETLADEESLSALVSFVMDERNGKAGAIEVKELFNLTDEELEEKILFLEYHFILTSTYECVNGKYVKYLSEFCEWNEWKKTSDCTIESTLISDEDVKSLLHSEFSFIEDMSLILELCNKKSLKVQYHQKEELFYLDPSFKDVENFYNSTPYYLARVINKNLLLGLIVIEEDTLRQTPPAKKWLATPIRQRTLITFKHPHNSLSHKCDFSFHQHDRNIIEVQKALSQIQNGSWTFFNEFIGDHLSKTNSLKQAELQKVGRKWTYTAAEYDDKEIAFIRTVILDWLFESGMIIPGKYQGKDCFKVTSLGYELYS